MRKFNCNQESVYEQVYIPREDGSQDINLVAFFDLIGDEMYVSGELEVRFQYSFIKSQEDLNSIITVKCSRKFRIEMKVVKPFVCHTEYQLMNPLLRETHSKVANSSNFLLYTQERAAVVSTLENRGFPIIIDQMEVRIMESAEKKPVLKIKELANYGVTQAELAANEHIKTHKYFIPLEPKEEMPALVLYVKWRRLDPKPKKLQKKYSIDLSSPTLNREESGLEGSTFNLEVSRMPLELQESTFGGPPTGSTDLASSQDNDSSANLSDRSFNKLNQSDSEQGKGDKSGNQGKESPALNVIPGYLRKGVVIQACQTRKSSL